MGARAAEAQDAFDALYRRTHQQVLGYCVRRTHRRSDALDAAADTYVVAWRRWDEVPTGDEDGRDAVLLWLFATARRVLANQRRSAARQDRVSRRLSAVPDAAPVGPDDAVIVLDEHADLLRALDRLSEDDQEILRLTTWEGLAPAQAAVVLGCSRGAVDVRLHRARKRLAARYERIRRTPRRDVTEGAVDG